MCYWGLSVKDAKYERVKNISLPLKKLFESFSGKKLKKTENNYQTCGLLNSN